MTSPSDIDIPMRYTLARALQLLGLLIAPMGIVPELHEDLSLGQSLLIAAGGVCVFYVGYILQQRS